MNDFYIVLRVRADPAARSTNMIGIKEDAAAHFEQYGDIAEIQVHEILPTQLAFKDIPMRQLDDKPPAPEPQPKPKKKRATPAAFVAPTLEEVLAYCRERRENGKGMTDEQVEDWFDVKLRSGWTYGEKYPKPVQDWRADFRTGERKQREWEKERHPELAAEAERESAIQKARELREKAEQERRALTNEQLAAKYQKAIANQWRSEIKTLTAEIIRRIDAGENSAGTVEEFIKKYEEQE